MFFRRKLLIVGLAIGTVAGYAAGFRSMRHCNYERGRHWGYERYEQPSPRSAYAEGFAAGARACADNTK